MQREGQAVEEEQTLATPRPRILQLQILRFVAAAGVLLSHAADVSGISEPVFRRFPWTAGVDIFFVISGIIMTILTAGRFGRAGESSHFLIRRIIRIVPIYWLFTGAMVAAILLLPTHVRHSQADPVSILTSILFVPWVRADGQIVPILSQGWTLNYEAFFYVAFALALLHRRGLTLLAAALVLVAALHSTIPAKWIALQFWTDPIILEFVAGIGLAKLWLADVRLNAAARVGLAIASLVLFVEADNLGLHALGRTVANGIPAALLAAAFLFGDGDERAGRIRGALITGGDASYALYLSHTFTINLVVMAIGSSMSAWPLLAIAFACSIAVSLGVHRLVERPLLRILHRRFGNST